MSSSSPRLSLSDCATALHLPPPTPCATPDAAALHAATTAPPSLTEAHVGSTLLLLLTVTPPPTAASPLAPLLAPLTNLSVTLGPTAAAARLCPLPLLRESSWQPVSSPAAAASPPLCKAFWVLLRAPPQTTHLSATPPLPGPQQLHLRLTHPSAPPARNSPVWATIDRAARLFAKPPVLHVTRPLLVNQPLEVSCTALAVARAAHPAFVSVAARNATQDAVINLLPPYLNLNHSRVVADPALCPAQPATLTAPPHPQTGKEPQPQIPALAERYEFVPVCPLPDPADEDDDFSADLSDLTNVSPAPNAPHPRHTPTGDDYGLFIPSFSHWQRRAVSLAPRDVFHFVYKIVDKGQTAADRPQPPAAPGTPPALRLKHGMCLETSVAVAWNCIPAHTPAPATPSAAPPPPDGDTPPELLQRELSSGGVLATGKRGNVAVRWTCVHWRPPALIDGLVVAFSGPPLCNVADTLSVAVTILNQTGADLTSAAVCVQQDPDAKPLLLALRTVVVVGQVPAGQEATLQIPCIALKAGTLSLGPVRVIDRAKHGGERTVWTSQATYEVFVADPHAPVPGDPQTHCSRMPVPDTEAKMAPA